MPWHNGATVMMKKYVYIHTTMYRSSFSMWLYFISPSTSHSLLPCNKKIIVIIFIRVCPLWKIESLCSRIKKIVEIKKILHDSTRIIVIIIKIFILASDAAYSAFCVSRLFLFIFIIIFFWFTFYSFSSLSCLLF
jgi:hypothetical protein